MIGYNLVVINKHGRVFPTLSDIQLDSGYVTMQTGDHQHLLQGQAIYLQPQVCIYLFGFFVF